MQEDRCLLILMNTPEDLTGLADAIPKASSKRKRADILPGSCIRLQPLAPTASESATMPLFQLNLVLGAILWLLSLTNCLVCSSGIALHLTACVVVHKVSAKLSGAVKAWGTSVVMVSASRHVL